VNQAPVLWHHVSPSLQSWSSEMSRLQLQSVMIAVSAEFTSPSSGLVSTGMHWARCVYNVYARMFAYVHHYPPCQSIFCYHFSLQQCIVL